MKRTKVCDNILAFILTKEYFIEDNIYYYD